jgi:copper(I)-binding protein
MRALRVLRVLGVRGVRGVRGVPLPAVGVGVLLVALGTAGLIRGASTQAVASGGVSSGVAPIIVTGAYVRPPAPPTQEAAAYFTVYNTTSRDDVLTSVSTGAGATAVLHTLINGVMTAVSGGVVIPAYGNLVLSTGTGHVMIGQLFGPLTPGQSVNLDLVFQNAGSITVTAPVIALGAPAPTGAAAPSGAGVPTSGAPTSGASSTSTGATK